jgi:hypothetical protein
MAIKTNGSGQKRVADSAVENSDELWKAAGHPFLESLQLIPGQILAGMRAIGKAQTWKGPESGKLGLFNAFWRGFANLQS